MFILESLTYDQFQVVSFYVVLIFSLAARLNKYLPMNYGKHFSTLFPFSVPGRIAWFLFEIPNIIITAYFVNQIKPSAFTCFLMVPFLIHYFNRSIIYPLRLQGTPKSIPLEICVFSFTFTTCNSYLQASSILSIRQGDWEDIINPKCILGLGIFFLGMWINVASDARLQALKEKVAAANSSKTEKKEYVIPTGWLFEYVCQPNYLGEIIEWIGFALFQPFATAPWLFAFSTLAVLSSRALDSHEWYKKTFPQFPKNRKAVIPFVL